jgi:hypothetical protein
MTHLGGVQGPVAVLIVVMVTDVVVDGVVTVVVTDEVVVVIGVVVVVVKVPGVTVNMPVAESKAPAFVWTVSVYAPVPEPGATMKAPVSVPALMEHACEVKRYDGIAVIRQVVPT